MQIMNATRRSKWMRVASFAGAGVLSVALASEFVLASQKTDKVFHAVATDAKGVDTEMRNLSFYWEEKINETSFVPHEMKEMPVKRGTATVKIKFESIKSVDVKAAMDGAAPAVSITLNDGKTGEFMLAIPGSFKGQSDFGDVEVPVAELKRLVFK